MLEGEEEARSSSSSRLPRPPMRLPISPRCPDLVAPVVPQVSPDPVVAPVIADPVATCVAPCGIPTPGTGTGSGGGVGPGAGPGSGPGSGPGAGPGTGSGQGGSSGTGIRPPAPLTILIPPTATAAVRGKSATIRLQVDTLGTVRGADVVVSSGDRGYDQQLRRVALGWRFRPARDAANRPIPYPFEVSLKF